HARPRAPHRRSREAGRDRPRQLRAAQPRADGPGARGEGRRRGPGHPRPGAGGRPRRRHADRRLGRHLPTDHGRLEVPAREGPPDRPRPPAPPEPAAAESRRAAEEVQAGAGPRDEHGAAAVGAARQVPDRRPGLQQDPGQAVQAVRDRVQDRRGVVVSVTLPVYTKKDFQTDQEVRWCPGCGDYAILSAVQSVFPELGIPKEKFVVVSGIGCSSRFPYYMNTFGFHTIHGRAPAVATGLQLARPDPEVWVATSDGDSL